MSFVFSPIFVADTKISCHDFVAPLIVLLKIKRNCISGLFCIANLSEVVEKTYFLKFYGFEPPPNQNKVKYSDNKCWVLSKPPTTESPTAYHLPTDPPTTYPPCHRPPIINLC